MLVADRGRAAMGAANVAAAAYRPDYGCAPQTGEFRGIAGLGASARFGACGAGSVRRIRSGAVVPVPGSLLRDADRGRVAGLAVHSNGERVVSGRQSGRDHDVHLLQSDEVGSY